MRYITIGDVYTLSGHTYKLQAVERQTAVIMDTTTGKRTTYGISALRVILQSRGIILEV